MEDNAQSIPLPPCMGKPNESLQFLWVKGFESKDGFSASAAVAVGTATIHGERSNFEGFAALFWSGGIKHVWHAGVSCRHTPQTRVCVCAFGLCIKNIWREGIVFSNQRY